MTAGFSQDDKGDAKGRLVLCIISYAGVSSDETFLKTIPIESPK
jgi:hypothetical protein